jgi:hypothetical protein
MFTQKLSFFFQKYSELAQDLIFINHEVEEPNFGDIPLVSSRPQGVTPSPAKRRRKSAPTTTPTMPVQKRGVGFASPTAGIMKPVLDDKILESLGTGTPTNAIRYLTKTGSCSKASLSRPQLAHAIRRIANSN